MPPKLNVGLREDVLSTWRKQLHEKNGRYSSSFCASWHHTDRASGIFLNLVVAEGAAILELLTGKDQVGAFSIPQIWKLDDTKGVTVEVLDRQVGWCR
jgi:hypothetical protein